LKQKKSEDTSYVSKNPKANITLEKALIDDVKSFIEARREDPSFLLKTPTALIREATINYIYPEKSTGGSNQKKIDKIRSRLESLEKKQADIAEAEQKIYLKMTAVLIDIFDKEHDFYEILKLNMDRLSESNIDAQEFRSFSREEIEKFFLDNMANPPAEYKDLINSNPLLQLLLMFLFLCNLGFTRKWDVVDPIAPLSMRFLELLKKFAKETQTK
jgi:hypothetical protein